MQSLLKAMNRDLQGLWIAKLARDPLLVSGLLLPVWCVGARTRFLMTHCTIPTFVNVFAGNLFIRLCNSYSALSVRYGSNTGRGPRRPRASAVFKAISHTKRTITIIYSVTMAP